MNITSSRITRDPAAGRRLSPAGAAALRSPRSLSSINLGGALLALGSSFVSAHLSTARLIHLHCLRGENEHPSIQSRSITSPLHSDPPAPKGFHDGDDDDVVWRERAERAQQREDIVRMFACLPLRSPTIIPSSPSCARRPPDRFCRCDLGGNIFLLVLPSLAPSTPCSSPITSSSPLDHDMRPRPPF